MSITGKPRARAALALLFILISSSAGAQSTPGAVYVATYIEVQPAAANQGVALIEQYRQASRAEAGYLAADAFQEIGRSNRFVVVEVWKDSPSFDSHEKAQRTAQFRDRIKAIQTSPYDQRVGHGLAIDPAPAPAGNDAVFVVTHVDVPPPARNGAEGLLRSVAEESRKDASHVRYDVYQQNDPRTNHFTVFAGWKNLKAFEANETKPHWLQFREALGPMLGALYDERLYKALKP